VERDVRVRGAPAIPPSGRSRVETGCTRCIDAYYYGCSIRDGFTGTIDGSSLDMPQFRKAQTKRIGGNGDLHTEQCRVCVCVFVYAEPPVSAVHGGWMRRVHRRGACVIASGCAVERKNTPSGAVLLRVVSGSNRVGGEWRVAGRHPKELVACMKWNG